MKTIKGLLIDPAALTVTEVMIGQDYREIYKAIGCETFACSKIGPRNDALYYDDEFLLRAEAPLDWFFDGRNLIAGKALVLGTDDEGESVDTALDAKTVRQHIMFLHRYGEALHAVGHDPIGPVPTPGFTVIISSEG